VSEQKLLSLSAHLAFATRRLARNHFQLRPVVRGDGVDGKVSALSNKMLPGSVRVRSVESSSQGRADLRTQAILATLYAGWNVDIYSFPIRVDLRVAAVVRCFTIPSSRLVVLLV